MPITLPGTGEVVRTDTVSGEKVEEIKLGFGAAGTFTGITEDDPLPTRNPEAWNAGSGDNVMELPSPGTDAWVHRNAEYLTSQSGVELWDPASGQRCVVRQVGIEWYGDNDGNIFVWSSRSGATDADFTPDTDQLIAWAHATPTTKGNGGRDRHGLWVTGGANYGVRVTTTGNVNCTITLEGYEETPPA